MCVYMNCVVYHRGRFWILKDDRTGRIVHHWSEYEFRNVDHLEFIRKYRAVGKN